MPKGKSLEIIIPNLTQQQPLFLNENITSPISFSPNFQHFEKKKKSFQNLNFNKEKVCKHNKEYWTSRQMACQSHDKVGSTTFKCFLDYL